MSTREKRRDVLLFDLLMMIDPNFENQYIIQICNPEEDWESFQSFRNSSRLLEPFYDMRIEGIDAISEGVFRIMFCEEDWAKIRGFSALPCKVGDMVYEIIDDDLAEESPYIKEYEVEDISVKQVKYGGDWTDRNCENLYFTKKGAEWALELRKENANKKREEDEA